MARIETVYPIIRNQRPRRWMGALILAIPIVLWITVCGFAFHQEEGLLLAIVVAALIGTGLFILMVWTYQPPDRLVLSEDIVTFPAGQRLDPVAVREVLFSPDPDEDYVESSLPIRLCQLTVRLKMGRSIRMIVSTGDAARFRTWATARGITMHDPEGFSRSPAEHRALAVEPRQPGETE